MTSRTTYLKHGVLSQRNTCEWRIYFFVSENLALTDQFDNFHSQEIVLGHTRGSAPFLARLKNAKSEAQFYGADFQMVSYLAEALNFRPK